MAVGRMSTEDEVKKLLQLGWQQGETVTHEAMEEILAPLTRHDRRFKTIRQALIAHLLKWQNVVAKVKLGVGVQVLYQHERSDDIRTTKFGRIRAMSQRAKHLSDLIPIHELEGLYLEDAQHTRRAAHRIDYATAAEVAQLATRPSMPAPTPAPARRPVVHAGDAIIAEKAS